MTRNVLKGLIALLVAVVATTAWSASGQAKLARDLAEELDRGAPEPRVIITHDERLDGQELESLRTAGPELRQRLSSIRALSGRFTRAELERLAEDPRVLSISPDRRVIGSLDVAVAATGAGRITEHLGYGGEGVTVALIDSGLTPSDAIPTSRIVASVDFTDERSTDDGFGHGTHVAGIIGGSGCDGAVGGVASGVRFVSLKALDGQGAGYASDVIEAIEFAVDNRDRYGIRIINMSLGHPVMESYRTDPLARAVEYAWSRGILVVASAGNRGRDGYMTINSPGNDPYVLTVGAMNDLNTEVRADDIITTYSSRGPSFGDHVVKPDLVAPGNRIVSSLAPGAAVAELFPDNVVADDRIELSGSSMATGMVSGVAAILLERNPRLTNDQLKAILMYSTDKLDDEDVFAVGAGYLQAVRAVAMTLRFPSVYFNSSSPIIQPKGEGFVLVNAGILWGGTALWTDTALWSDTALWTDTALWSDTALWTDTALWSDTALWTDTALWGDTALWTDTALWSDTALWTDTALWSDTALWTDTALWSDSILGNGD